MCDSSAVDSQTTPGFAALNSGLDVERRSDICDSKSFTIGGRESIALLQSKKDHPYSAWHQAISSPPKRIGVSNLRP